MDTRKWQEEGRKTKEDMARHTERRFGHTGCWLEWRERYCRMATTRRPMFCTEREELSLSLSNTKTLCLHVVDFSSTKTDNHVNIHFIIITLVLFCFCHSLHNTIQHMLLLAVWLLIMFYQMIKSITQNKTKTDGTTHNPDDNITDTSMTNNSSNLWTWKILIYAGHNQQRWLRSFSNLDQSRFVRRDRSSPVKKNAQLFLVVVGMVTTDVSANYTDSAILFSSAQSAADHALSKQTMPAPGSTDGHG